MVTLPHPWADLSVKKIPPDIQSKSSPAQLKTTSSHHVAGCLVEEASPHLAKTSFQVVEEIMVKATSF